MQVLMGATSTSPRYLHHATMTVVCCGITTMSLHMMQCTMRMIKEIPAQQWIRVTEHGY